MSTRELAIIKVDVIAKDIHWQDLNAFHHAAPFEFPLDRRIPVDEVPVPIALKCHSTATGDLRNADQSGPHRPMVMISS